jgi:hypothetical protein
MMKVFKTVAVLGLAGLATACSSDSQVDIGDGSLNQGLAAYADSWEGYAEAYQFDDGSDRVRLTLDESGHGFVRFGDTPLLPAPMPGDCAPALTSLATDFSYAVSAHLEDGRLRFDLDYWQRYGAWCELQTPVPYWSEAPDVYACFRRVPVTAYPDGTCVAADNDEVVPCTSRDACEAVCACTEESCTASPLGPGAQAENIPPSRSSVFDGALSQEGDSLVGTLATVTDVRIPLRLRRQ